MGWGGDGPQDFVTNCMWRVRERKKRKLIEWVCNNLILCVFGSRYSFFVAMGYLTICHISRIYIFHYGILTTDFSG